MFSLLLFLLLSEFVVIQITKIWGGCTAPKLILQIYCMYCRSTAYTANLLHILQIYCIYCKSTAFTADLLHIDLFSSNCEESNVWPIEILARWELLEIVWPQILMREGKCVTSYRMTTLFWDCLNYKQFTHIITWIVREKGNLSW